MICQKMYNIIIWNELWLWVIFEYGGYSRREKYEMSVEKFRNQFK